MRHVALVGFMAAGKTTVGRALARRLGWRFIDTDELVEAEHGSIARIFEERGEAPFRQLEERAVERALSHEEPCVVAVGGGAVTHEPTRALLAAHAYRVFLAAPEQHVARRIRMGPPRPALGSEPATEVIEALYRKRLPLYEDSDVKVDCANLRPPAIAQRIHDLLQRAGVA